MKAVRVWFQGSTAVTTIAATEVFIGGQGELKLFQKEQLVSVIAPGQWVFFEVVR
jgi:hypothetical protein